MRRVGGAVLLLVSGVVAGALVMLSVQGAAEVSEVASTSLPPSSITLPDPESTMVVEPTTSMPVEDRVLLVWAPQFLPGEVTSAVAATEAVRAISVVAATNAHLTGAETATGVAVPGPPDGYVIPVEVIEFDPATYSPFTPPDVRHFFADPAPDSVILGETSARLRGVEPGGRLHFADGRTVVVAAVVPDAVVGGAEVAAASDLGLANAPPRYMLARYQGDRDEVEVAIRAALPGDVAVRIRGPGETPLFRHGDAVLAQAQIKERFGEFAYRPGSDQGFEIDPAWLAEHIVTAEVPLLGTMHCHRAIVPLVIGAMQELVDRGLGHLVDPATFRGCFNPRFIAGRRDLSRHAWGVALDINWGSNPTGLASAQDPRLVETMDRWGFTSGHDWLVPDPGHFEWHHRPAGGA